MNSKIIFIFSGVILCLLICMFFMELRRCCIDRDSDVLVETIHSTDTVVIHDTLRIIEPKMQLVEVTRIDTIAQTDTVTITVPIERKVYANNDYEAVIEGYKPNLLSLDIYQKMTTIHDTVQVNTLRSRVSIPRWAITAGGGVGYGFRGIEPYIGVSVGYVLWTK